MTAERLEQLALYATAVVGLLTTAAFPLVLRVYRAYLQLKVDMRAAREEVEGARAQRDAAIAGVEAAAPEIVQALQDHAEATPLPLPPEEQAAALRAVAARALKAAIKRTALERGVETGLGEAVRAVTRRLGPPPA